MYWASPALAQSWVCRTARQGHNKDNGIQLGVKGYEVVDCDVHACISSHVICVGLARPGSGLKECDESDMHTHMLFATF